MPVYEYECLSCKDKIEVWQSMADDPMTTCPSCKGNLKKLISMSSFQLKGGGWYADGYSSSTGGACKSSECSSASSSTGSSCEGKSSSTPPCKSC